MKLSTMVFAALLATTAADKSICGPTRCHLEGTTLVCCTPNPWHLCLTVSCVSCNDTDRDGACDIEFQDI